MSDTIRHMDDGFEENKRLKTHITILETFLNELHTEAELMMDEINAIQISSGTVACRLVNEARYGFIAKSKSIREAMIVPVTHVATKQNSEGTQDGTLEYLV